jgi:uncharacterized protein
MTSRLMKALLVTLGTLSVGLGVVGIFLPLLPTTVFLLLAAACYARSSDRFYQWLIHHRWLGRYIRNHYEGRGMSRRDKTVTLVALWAGIGATATWSVESLGIRLLLVGIALAVTMHVAKLKAFEEAGSGEKVEARS